MRIVALPMQILNKAHCACVVLLVYCGSRGPGAPHQPRPSSATTATGVEVSYGALTRKSAGLVLLSQPPASGAPKWSSEALSAGRQVYQSYIMYENDLHISSILAWEESIYLLYIRTPPRPPLLCRTLVIWTWFGVYIYIRSGFTGSLGAGGIIHNMRTPHLKTARNAH